MKYILKDGTEVESIPIGRSTMKIGQVSPDGMLTICDRGPNKPGITCARAICKCICGNYTIVTMNAFNNGSTKSCGCYNKQIHKEICAEVGKQSKKGKDYTLVENPFYRFCKRLDEKGVDNCFLWEIECKNCGRHYKESPSQLVSYKRNRGNNPCKCWKNISKGNLKIANILQQEEIPFIEEYSFSDCLSPKGNPMKFDFYVDNKYLIEYDGIQHTQAQSFGDTKHTAEEKFLLTQEYDEIKNKYCQEHQIPLIRIPYTYYNNIQLKDLLLDSTSFIYK